MKMRVGCLSLQFCHFNVTIKRLKSKTDLLEEKISEVGVGLHEGRVCLVVDVADALRVVEVQDLLAAELLVLQFKRPLRDGVVADLGHLLQDETKK